MRPHRFPRRQPPHADSAPVQRRGSAGPLAPRLLRAARSLPPVINCPSHSTFPNSSPKSRSVVSVHGLPIGSPLDVIQPAVDQARFGEPVHTICHHHRRRRVGPGTHPPLERSGLAVRSVWFAVTGVSCDDSLVISETPGVERRSGRGLPSREKKHRSGRYAFRTRLHRGAGGSYTMRTSRRNRFAGSRKQVRQRHRGVALLARGQYLPAQDTPSTARSMMAGWFFLVIAGSCQFGHGLGGFTTNLIHSPPRARPLLP